MIAGYEIIASAHKKIKEFLLKALRMSRNGEYPENLALRSVRRAEIK